MKGVDRAAEIAVEATLRCLRREEVENAGGCIADFWLEAWSLTADEVECCRYGLGDWEGRRDKKGISVGFDEVAAFDVTDHVEGIDCARDCWRLFELFVGGGLVDLFDEGEVGHDC